MPKLGFRQDAWLRQRLCLCRGRSGASGRSGDAGAAGLRSPFRYRRRRADHAVSVADRRRADGDVQRRWQPRRDVRQRDSVRRAAALRNLGRARESDRGRYRLRAENDRAEWSRAMPVRPRPSIWASRFWKGAKFRWNATAGSSLIRSKSAGANIESPRSRWAIRIAWSSSMTRAYLASTMSEFARLGSQFEHHPFFPSRVNTEFILPTLA